MAVLPIIRLGHPVLRQQAKPVEKVTKRVQKLIQDMCETMYAADGIGLAAPQVGISERVIVVDHGEGWFALINPVILERSGSDTDREGCLSIPGVSGYVTRSSRVVVTGLNEKGKVLKMEATGLKARVLQHEIDHLDGILFIDKATGVSERAKEKESEE